jgi:5'-3' exonuclease
MKALIDGDILRYELGFASETGWHGITGDDEAVPPFGYVSDLLHARIDSIMEETGSDSYTLFLTEGPTFRFDIAKRKPYKGTRPSNKPWHYQNLTVYMTDVLKAEIITHIEADDALAIAHLDPETETVLCSRDKDLRQVPGRFYSWELGMQPSFGPADITQVGSLSLSDGKTKKLTGTGFAWFCAQVLTGDTVDNIPGLPKCGPVAAYQALYGHIPDPSELEAGDGYDQYVCNHMIAHVGDLYAEKYGPDWEDELLEQGRLCWMTRRLNPDGTPELWEIGKTS